MSKRLDYNQIAPEGLLSVRCSDPDRPVLAASTTTSPRAADRRRSSTVYLRVPQIRNCAYCLDTHTRDLLRKGQSVEKLAAGLVSEVTSALGSCPWPLA